MSTLYLTAIGLHARLVSDHLEIELPERVTPASAAHPQQRNVPLAEIERVIVGTTVSLSTPALVALLSRNVPVVFFGGKQAPAGIGMSARRNTAPLMAQLDTHRDGAARLAGARALIVAKVLNMRRVLQRMAANRERECAGASLLGDLAREAERAHWHVGATQYGTVNGATRHAPRRRGATRGCTCADCREGAEYAARLAANVG